MEMIEKNPLPEVCAACQELDCWECDYAGERWFFSEACNQAFLRKMKERAIARCQRLLAESQEER